MYIKRNEQGQIVAVSQTVEQAMKEYIADDAVELQQFLQAIKLPHHLMLEETDQSMARVMEDVVNLLVEQGTIRFTDLPQAAQVKLLSRRELRSARQGIDLLDDGDDLKI